MRRLASIAACVLTGALVSACGSAHVRAPIHAVRPNPKLGRTVPVPAPGSTTAPGATTTPGATGSTGASPRTGANPGVSGSTRPDPAAIAVIAGWASALRRGDVNAAARYFALPSEFANGTDAHGNLVAVRITTERQARIVNASLPCGAAVLNARTRGPYIDVLFRLSGRPGVGGTNCGAASGASARTFFVISHGKIEHWFRAPPEPGDPGTSGGTGTHTAPLPTTTPGGGVPVA